MQHLAVRITCGIAWTVAVFAGCSLPSQGLGPDFEERMIDGGTSVDAAHRPVDATPGADSADERAEHDASGLVDSTARGDGAGRDASSGDGSGDDGSYDDAPGDDGPCDDGGGDDADTPDGPTDDGESGDGSACSTPTCCGGQSAFAHSDGMGHMFYDCTPLSTYDTTEARAACSTYAASISGNPSYCTETPCGGSVSWCYVDPSGFAPCSPCWYYSGAETSFVDDCVCPGDQISVWN